MSHYPVLPGSVRRGRDAMVTPTGIEPVFQP